MQLLQDTSKEINKFFGEYRFLSNFYSHPIDYNGITYGSSEAAYQAQKFTDPADRMKVSQMSPRDAKAYGRLAKLPVDWDTKKIKVMLEILRIKFSDPILRRLLLKTGELPLIEGNTWGDRIWGKTFDPVTNEYVGNNLLGEILMQIRSEIKSTEIDTNYLLICLMEEAAEIAVEASKILRFGRNDNYRGDDNTPESRLAIELDDLIAIHRMLIKSGMNIQSSEERIAAKTEKLLKFYEYSIQQKTPTGKSKDKI